MTLGSGRSIFVATYLKDFSLEAAVVIGVITSGIGMNGYGLVIGITGGIEVDNSTFRAQGKIFHIGPLV